MAYWFLRPGQLMAPSRQQIGEPLLMSAAFRCSRYMHDIRSWQVSIKRSKDCLSSTIPRVLPCSVRADPSRAFYPSLIKPISFISEIQVSLSEYRGKLADRSLTHHMLFSKLILEQYETDDDKFHRASVLGHARSRNLPRQEAEFFVL